MTVESTVLLAHHVGVQFKDFLPRYLCVAYDQPEKDTSEIVIFMRQHQLVYVTTTVPKWGETVELMAITCIRWLLLLCHLPLIPIRASPKKTQSHS